jgi:hypothetical protein
MAGCRNQGDPPLLLLRDFLDGIANGEERMLER